MTDFTILTEGTDGLTVAALTLATARLTVSLAMVSRAQQETTCEQPRANAIKVRRRFALRALREALQAADVARILLEADVEGAK